MKRSSSSELTLAIRAGLTRCQVRPASLVFASVAPASSRRATQPTSSVRTSNAVTWPASGGDVSPRVDDALGVAGDVAIAVGAAMFDEHAAAKAVRARSATRTRT